MKIWLLVLFSCLGIAGVSQSLGYESDAILIKFEYELDNAKSGEVVHSLGIDTLLFDSTISKRYNIQKFYVESSEPYDLEELCRSLSSKKEIAWASPDYFVEHRAVPNDDRFTEQWDMEIIQAVDAWDITKGGVNLNGDTLVVAVIDDGFLVDHEDLKDNLWINRAEIDGDGMDNDNNGLIDDIIGWNFLQDSNIHTVETHGTSVTGIIGAKGNNAQGVVGVNWNIKYLLITGIGTVSHVIESYEYVINMRQAYDLTGGTRGAYVVASNFSGGVPEVFPEPGTVFEQWCNLYDDLGELGILNVGATTNLNLDVDVDGDVPSLCPSDYLIITTNTNIDDQRVGSSGTGAISVDLGAPGTGTFTVNGESVSGYSPFGGTSASTPHVTGAAALLFSVPCPEFQNFYQSNPSEGVMSLKQAILDGTDPNASLEGETVTGGRLNVFKSMEQLRGFCAGTSGPFEIISVYPNPIIPEYREIFVEYETPDFKEYVLDIYDCIGRLVHTQKVNPPFFGDEKVISIPLSSAWTNGMYYLRLSNDESSASSIIQVLSKY